METLPTPTGIRASEIEHLAQIILRNRGIEMFDNPDSYTAAAIRNEVLTVEGDLLEDQEIQLITRGAQSKLAQKA
jgi:hypothetical protein